MKQLLDLFRSSPGYEDLIIGLRSWNGTSAITRLSAQDASITRAIVNDILPHYWPVSAEDLDLRTLLIQSLSSLAGINALLARRGELLFLTVLQTLVESDQLQPHEVYRACFVFEVPKTSKTQQCQMLWSQYISLFAGGKILSLAAEGLIGGKVDDPDNIIWINDRATWIKFLAKRFAQLVNCDDLAQTSSMEHSSATFVDRSMSLGNCYLFWGTFLSSITLSKSRLDKFASIVQHCSQTVLPKIVSDLLTHMENTYLTAPVDRTSLKGFKGDSDRVGAVATFIQTFDKECFEVHISNTLLHRSSMHNLSLRRAVVLSMPPKVRLKTAERCLEQWADRMYIKHSSTFAQECLTESILFLGAYLSAHELITISKSQAFTVGISNHLESTAERIRFLGMIVGETISAQVIADEKKRLTFGVPDTQTSEARWWRSLIEMEDEVVDLSHLESGFVEQPDDGTVDSPDDPQEFDISELMADDVSDSSDDPEFPAMRVPDSDDEDSDEDPTLIDREKLRPPVYIRDLIKMLNNHESYKHVSLALHTAPSLIRRKAEFGNELVDYAINLTQLFAGLRDTFEMDDFQQLRQDALRALVVAAPKIVCPYLAQTFFTGDYSLQQRIIILSAIGLGSRELAGALEVAPELRNLTVSKILPASTRRNYESITDISTSVRDQILNPIAQEAAQVLAGPEMLKVIKTTRRPRPPAPIRLDNKLTAVVAESILFPLLGRFQIHAGKMIDHDANAFYEANLLSYYIRTLSLVFQCSSASPSHARLTIEFWDLILSLRAHRDREVLSSLLFALLVIVEASDGRVLAVQCSRQLIETQEWVSAVFDDVKDRKEQVMAAGLLIRMKEIVEANHMTMMQSITSIDGIGRGRGRFGIAGLK